MVARNIIKTLTKAENLRGVYRNYVFLSKYLKILSALHIIFDIVVYPVILHNNVTVISQVTNNRIYRIVQILQVTIFLSSPVIVISGCLSSRSYKLFIENILSVHKYFQNEPTYIRNSKKLKKNILITTVLSIALIMLALLIKLVCLSFIRHLEMTMKVIVLTISHLMLEERIIIEHIVMYTYITMVKDLLRCVNNGIFDVQVKFNDIETELCSDGTEWNDVLTVEQVEQWATQFKCLLTCSRNLSVCFKAQVYCLMSEIIIFIIKIIYSSECNFVHFVTDVIFVGPIFNYLYYDVVRTVQYLYK